ncbi:MAG: peptide ABC transporter substrate-binding protein [Treponema sp.]
MNKKIVGLVLALLLLPVFLFSETVQEGYPQSEFIASLSSGIPNLHPHAAYNADEAQILTALYEGLCVYDPYSLQPVAGLAKSWKISSDGLTWTFTLRDNLVFENGDPITAETFRASFINLLNPDLNLPYASLLDCVRGAKEYRSGTLTDAAHIGLYAESGNTLKISLVYPAEHLANILCHHAFSAVHPSQLEAVAGFAGKTVFMSAAEAFTPIASGPFKIDSFTAEHIHLVKNVTYWDTEAVALPSINLLLAADADDAAEAFNQGAVHWLGSAVNLNKVAASHTIHVTPMFATEYLYLKTDTAPCDDAAVREALLAALPYDDLRKEYLIPAKTLVFPLAGYPTVNGVEKKDVPRAEKLLKKHPQYAEIPPVKILLPETVYHSGQAAVLKDAWEQIHVPVEVSVVPFEEYYDRLKRNDYHVAVVSWIGDFADPLAFLELFRPQSSLNNSGWNSAEYENYIKKASAEQNRKKRFEYLAKAEQLLLDSSVIIPLSHIPAINIIDLNEIKGWYTNAVNIHPFKFIRFVQPDPLPGVAFLARKE